MSETTRAESLDLRGVPCPANAMRALLKLEQMGPGEVLELFLDDGEPVKNVTLSLEDEGHQLLSKEKITNQVWLVQVKV